MWKRHQRGKVCEETPRETSYSTEHSGTELLFLKLDNFLLFQENTWRFRNHGNPRPDLEEFRNSSKPYTQAKQSMQIIKLRNKNSC